MKQLDHSLGLFVVRRHRGLAFLALRETTQAVDLLEELLDSPLVVRKPRLRLALLEARLRALCALGDAKRVRRLWAEYEAIPARRRPATVERDVWLSLGHFQRAQGEDEGACKAYTRVLTAVRTLDDSLTHAEDRARFRRGHAGLLAEVQGSFAALGKEDEAEEVAGLFLGDEQYKARQREKQARRSQCLLFCGASVWLASWGLVVLVLVSIVTSKREPSFPEIELIVTQSIGSCFVLVCGLYTLMLGRWLTNLRSRLGGILLAIAAFTWLIWLVGMVMWMLREE